MTLDRWTTFPKRQQLLFIGSEFERARVWQEKQGNEFYSALERAFELIDLALQDPKWKPEILQLLALRAEIAKFYIGERKDKIDYLYQVL